VNIKGYLEKFDMKFKVLHSLTYKRMYLKIEFLILSVISILFFNLNMKKFPPIFSSYFPNFHEVK